MIDSILIDYYSMYHLVTCTLSYSCDLAILSCVSTLNAVHTMTRHFYHGFMRPYCHPLNDTDDMRYRNF